MTFGPHPAGLRLAGWTRPTARVLAGSGGVVDAVSAHRERAPTAFVFAICTSGECLQPSAAKRVLTRGTAFPRGRGGGLAASRPRDPSIRQLRPARRVRRACWTTTANRPAASRQPGGD